MGRKNVNNKWKEKKKIELKKEEKRRKNKKNKKIRKGRR